MQNASSDPPVRDRSLIVGKQEVIRYFRIARVPGQQRSEAERNLSFLWGLLVGARNGTAVGFAVGFSAEKGAMKLSGLLAGFSLAPNFQDLQFNEWRSNRFHNRHRESLDILNQYDSAVRSKLTGPTKE